MDPACKVNGQRENSEGKKGERGQKKKSKSVDKKPHNGVYVLFCLADIIYWTGLLLYKIRIL